MKRVARDGCVLAKGLNYLSFLEMLHQKLRPEWYLEIGTQTGASLVLSSAKSIAVDPVYRLRHEVIGDKPELHVFQETSDAFFEANRLKKLGVEVDLAFLDGMHLFDFLLRDFIGTEKHCSPDGAIILHDCLPWDVAMTARERGKGPTSSWTGDVWKMVPILQKYRPDLTLEIVDAAPTGLVIVSNLDPKSRVLEKKYDNILKEWLEIDLGDYGVDQYLSSFHVTPAHASRWAFEYPRHLGKGWQSNPDICIKIAASTQAKMVNWGDYYFALGMARAFSELGHRVTIASQENWNKITSPGGIDLVLRGRAQVPRIPGRTCLFWAISKGMRDMNYNEADHVFWASPTEMADGQKGRGEGISSFLPQAFDAHAMSPGSLRSRKDIVFVGRARSDHERVAIKYAVGVGEDVKIWGPGWNDTEYADHVVADGIANSDLHKIYQSAQIVLNDHTKVMKDRGLLSNRVFDALACGAIPISEDVGFVPDDIAEFVYTFKDEKSFKTVMKAAKSESEGKREKRMVLAKELAKSHSFHARARTILDVAISLNSETEVAAE